LLKIIDMLICDLDSVLNEQGIARIDTVINKVVSLCLEIVDSVKID